MPNILLVCTGNLCRSPMAEVLLRRKLAREGLDKEGWTVESAGTWAQPGQPASGYAIQVMAERELDLSAHRSKPIDRPMMEKADLVLVMTRHHAEALRSEFPDLKDKVWLLSQMDGDRIYDVNDPYGGSLIEYQYCATELEELIEGGLERMRALLKA